jgi:hypothetical protein
MDVSRALTQIAEIHQQIAKGEVYRGYRSVPVAASGVIGLVAAAVQPRHLATADPSAFVLYWSSVAAIAGLVGISEIAYNYLVRENVADRRRTRRVISQFLPGVMAAVAVTASFMHLSVTLVPLLPGIWAICFGIGVFASRPYLPRASGFVALFYYAAGFVLLWRAQGIASLDAWWVGGTFGVGQLMAAMVLYWHLERHEHAAEDE